MFRCIQKLLKNLRLFSQNIGTETNETDYKYIYMSKSVSMLDIR